MATPKHLRHTESRGAASVIITGNFVTNGDSAPVAGDGEGFTVSAPVAGVYTISLIDGPVSLFGSAHVTIAPAATNSTARAFPDGISLLQLTTGGQFQIVTQSSDGTPANLAANAALVSFTLVVGK